jgi:excisionase family DNA binding protein
VSRQQYRARQRHNPNPELIGLTEAADRCGVCYRTIRRYISQGRLNAVRIGPRLLKVDAADVDALKSPVGGAA